MVPVERRYFVNKLAQIGIIIALPFFLIISAIRILTSPQYLSFEYNKPAFPADKYGFSMDERREIAISSLKFVREPLPIEFLGNQTYAGQPLFNERELGHMTDVQNVFRGAWSGWGIATLILFVSGVGLWIKPKTRSQLFQAIEIGGAVTVLAIITVGTLAVIGWDSWFTAFHQLFFLPGSWLFSPADTLIRLFPIKFWFDSVLLISVLTLVGGFTATYTGYKLRIREVAQVKD